MRYLIPLFPGQIRLACTGRTIQLVVPNYFRVYPESEGYVNTDGSIIVFAIEASPDQVNVVQEGSSVQHLLWKGNKNSRDNSADLVSVPVESRISAAADTSGPALAEAQSKITVLTAQLGAAEAKAAAGGLAIVELEKKLADNFAAAEKAIAEAQARQSQTQSTIVQDA